jgi:hypothetical protein
MKQFFEYKILVKTMKQYKECGFKEFGSCPKPEFCPIDAFRFEKYYRGFVACFNKPNTMYANQYFWGETKEEALRKMFKKIDWK